MTGGSFNYFFTVYLAAAGAIIGATWDGQAGCQQYKGRKLRWAVQSSINITFSFSSKYFKLFCQKFLETKINTWFTASGVLDGEGVHTSFDA